MRGILADARPYSGRSSEAPETGRAGYPAFSVWPEQARALARLGDKDGAFERLSRFLETRNPALPLLTDEPDFVTLRDDPRWTVDYDLVYKRKK